ncbi:HsdM family class I SAM-dependent methyltransferase [Deinococcus marmoris]|uniref:site-specific DNA-methyltransferase (adenine-specific) n=1 Tax=Deinococcus marmoris TaxID=249408 RepID=A0A1U7P227_9DEIO|nr:N-6 DNA methylase [Deinococcus marmoris]OLV19227.1 Type I restriction-modification system, DNA-methyltransferase subunit M [Deinococcus marmoris]
MPTDLMPLMNELRSFKSLNGTQDRLLLLGEVLFLQAVESFSEVYAPLDFVIDTADMAVLRSTQASPSDVKGKVDGLLKRVELPSLPTAGDRVSAQELSRLLRSVNTLVETLARDTHGLPGLLQLGQAYSELIERDYGRSESLTPPKSVSQLLAEVLAPEDGMTVLDLTPEMGAALVGLTRYIRTHDRDPNRVKFTYIAQGAAARITALHLLLNGVISFKPQTVDLLAEPDLIFCDADRVVATPPTGSRLQDTIRWPDDDHGLLFSPRKWPRTAEWHHILVGMSHLKAGGRAAFLIPYGPLFRMGSEADTRQDIAAAGWLHSVTALPSGLFAYTNLYFALTVFERPSAAKTAYTDIQFIDATQLGVRDGRQQTLPTAAIELLADVINERTERPGLATLVSRLDVHANDDNWQPNQYFEQELQQGRSLEEITLELEQAIADVAIVEQRAITALAALPR